MILLLAFLLGLLAGALLVATVLAWCERDRGRGGYLDLTAAPAPDRPWLPTYTERPNDRRGER